MAYRWRYFYGEGDGGGIALASAGLYERIEAAELLSSEVGVVFTSVYM